MTQDIRLVDVSEIEKLNKIRLHEPIPDSLFQTREVPYVKLADVLDLLSRSPQQSSEAVAEALQERDKLGHAVVNVIRKLDEIAEITQEIELDDIIQVAIPMDDWAALQDALDGMPQRASTYTHAPNSVPVGLTDDKLNELITEYHPKAQKGVKRFEVTDWWRFGKAVQKAMLSTSPTPPVNEGSDKE